MTHYQSYIICTSPRSGSTLLCRLLAATNMAGKPDSHFHSPSVSDWAGYYGLSPERFTTEQELLTAIFKAAQARGTGETGLFGLRLQAHSQPFFLKKLRDLYQADSADSDSDLIQQSFGNTLFIHLYRENKLEQAISLEMARQTGLWHKAADGTELERTSPPREPVYNANSIERHRQELIEWEALWTSWIDKQGLEPLHISYDELSTDPTVVLARILERLNLDSSIAQSIALPVAKLANATNAEWASRFMREKHGWMHI